LKIKPSQLRGLFFVFDDQSASDKTFQDGSRAVDLCEMIVVFVEFVNLGTLKIRLAAVKH